MGNVIRLNGLWCDPSKLDFSIQSVSAPDAGRDQTGTMHVQYQTTKIKIALEWWYPTPETVAEILKAVEPSRVGEYIPVLVRNPITNEAKSYNMYLGDRNLPYQMWGSRKLFQRLAFDLIEI